MAVDNSLLSAWQSMQEKNAKQDEAGEGLKGGGGDGTFNGMEARVAKLESGVDDIKKSLGDVRVTLASIDERTKKLPDKWDVFLILAGVLAVLTTVVTITLRVAT